MRDVKIRDVKAICTAPQKINLIVVKVETTEPGLYGLGCATFAYRHKAVACVVDEYLKPLLVGRSVSNIEELWQLMNVNAYWRNGPISNNAISGVDMALWDIKGKMAGMPVYDLLGGKCREGVPVYRHASGDTPEAVGDRVEQFIKQGVRVVRVDMGGYGGKAKNPSPDNAPQGVYFEPNRYVTDTVELFRYLRMRFHDSVELCHDVHERIAPAQALWLAKALEPYRLFFLEDLLSPEQAEWFKTIKGQTSTPLAMGELFNNPKEWEYLISHRLIDFIRVHISQTGGLTPARKLAVLCEAFGIRTAWHGPGDVSPVGHAANIHLSLASHNFGIQEWSGIEGALTEVFPGCPELRNGYVYANANPGFGIGIDEKLAAEFPCDGGVTAWTQTRLSDGTLTCP